MISRRAAGKAAAVIAKGAAPRRCSCSGAAGQQTIVGTWARGGGSAKVKRS